MRVVYKSLVFQVFPGVYAPCDDSFLLADNLKVKKGEAVLDMGTGCGMQGIVAARQGGRVVACDVSAKAVECARYNARRNKVGMSLVRSDLFKAIKGSFDLLVFNPPYLPSEPSEEKDEEALSWDGGRDGRAVINRFIRECPGYLNPGGRVLLVASSLTGIQEVMDEFAERGFKPHLIARKPFLFEEVVLLEAFL